MAQCLRKPILSPPAVPLFRALQKRPFSIAAPQWAMAGGELGPQPRQQSERSVKVAAREMGKMVNDMGLIPQTIIFPQGSNRPSLFRQPRDLARLNFIWLKRRLQAYFALILYKITNKPRLKLYPRQVAPTAVGLHRQMYSAVAEGDVQLLDRICCDGLRESLRTRVAGRPRGEHWEWELLRYTRRPRVVSHRAASLGIDGMGLRQAVVRIASQQRLTRYRPNGSVVPGSGAVKDTVEYLVIQRKLERSVEQDWMVWGTTEETTLEMIEEEDEKLADMLESR